MKICTKCKLTKEPEEFYKDSRARDGRYSKCRKCHNFVSVNWQKRRPEEVKLKSRTWSRNNKNKTRARSTRYRSNPEIRVKQRLWNSKSKKTNTNVVNAINASRRAKQFKATPPWTTPDMKKDIQFFYTIRSEMNNPKDWNIDHYYPLDGENCTGLHVAWNLRLLPAKANVSKSNSLPEPLPVFK
jgi:hypothetical protein